MSYDLKFTVCPKCGSHNWITTSYGAECLSCDWKYHGNIYQKDKEDEQSYMGSDNETGGYAPRGE